MDKILASQNLNSHRSGLATKSSYPGFATFRTQCKDSCLKQERYESLKKIIYQPRKIEYVMSFN